MISVVMAWPSLPRAAPLQTNCYAYALCQQCAVIKFLALPKKLEPKIQNLGGPLGPHFFPRFRPILIMPQQFRPDGKNHDNSWQMAG